MASAVELDLDSLTAPVSDDDPSGPDLEADEDGDDAYINFVSGTEVVLPTDYMVADHAGERLPFQNHPDFKDLDLRARIGAARAFCGATHDLRLLALLAKLCILNRSPTAFETAVQAMAVLLETEWDLVHPRLEGGSSEWRTAAVERLDEPLIIAALNNAPLFSSKQFGPLTMQAYATAARKASGGGTDTSSVDRVLARECDAAPEPVRTIRGTIERLASDLNRIRAAYTERSPGGGSRLTSLADSVAKLQGLFDRIDPAGSTPAEAGSPADDATPPGADAAQEPAARAAKPAIGTARQAASALDAATKYLVDTEPSSPALLLLRQAQSLVGKSFFESMKALFPDTVKHAGFSVATPAVFRLPLTMLAETGSPAQDAEDGTTAGDDGAIAAPRSRADAIALLEGASAYYRAAEPSSPIPMLLDRARPLLGQDFMALVRSMLPERVLAEK